MKKAKPNKKSKEGGITLISLIVMVMILIILSTVTISQITGDEGIIVSTQTASENYKIEQYREQIQQLLQSVILEHSILGEDVTIEEIAEEMEEEDWIKTAKVESENTILVTVTEGYMYEVYYDEDTGEKKVEYIGTENSGAVPTVTATFNSGNATIDVTAECSDGIASIELIYKSEVVATYTGNSSTSIETSFSVSKTGWYTVKVTSSTGIVKYAYVRVYTTITPPTIAVTSEGTQVNGWYGADGVALEVTITATDATKIYYKTSNDEEYISYEGTSKAITISTVGTTTIYAYSVDSSGNESNISSLEVKLDNVAPTIEIGDIEVTGTYVEADGGTYWYKTDVVISFANAMTDANSGVYGYYYYTGTNSANKQEVVGVSKTITVESEGTTILVVQAIDYAGNVSGESSITIHKDTTEPVAFVPEITDITTTGFTITAGTTDGTTGSGIAYYDFYIGDSCVSEKNTDGEYKATNLTANKSYTVYVIAYDKAGNSTTSTAVTAKTKGELLAPKIELAGDTINGTWYTGDITVTITDSADSETTGCTQIKYSISGGAVQTVSGTSTQFTITDDGTSKITAYVVGDSSTNTSESSDKTVYKDATAPSTATIEVADYDTESITVTATGADETSGVYSYEFRLSTTSTTEGFDTIETVITSNGTYSYTYPDLDAGTQYYLKVIVKDNAGLTTESEAISQKTEDAGMSSTELARAIGSYVDYTPTSGSFTNSKTYSGYSSNQSFSTVTTLNWRVLFVDDDTLTLISDTSANTGFYLSSYNGYNNGVKLLNDACEAMYSNSSLGATGRSLNVDDIQSVSSYKETSYSNYGKVYTPSYTEYPAIFALETTGYVNSAYGSTYERSQQDEYITGYSTASTLKGKYTYFSYTMSINYMDSVYYEMFSSQSGAVGSYSAQGYWLASRAVSLSEDVTAFCLFLMSSSDVYPTFLQSRTVANIPSTILYVPWLL